MIDKSAPIALQTPRLIKEARLVKGFTQEKLAEFIGVSSEMVSRWERGEASPRRINREKLSLFLDIQPEALNLQPQTDYTPDNAQLLIKNTEHSLDMGAFITALSEVTILGRNLARQVEHGEVDLLASLSYAQYLTGHAVSIAQDDPSQAFKSFKNMEHLARQINNQTLHCIALTYQGEMYRRMRKYDRAIYTIKKALKVPEVDAIAQGNANQLLARSYLAKGNTGLAIHAMKDAEELAYRSEKNSSGIYICFNLCSVYVDYAKMYMRMGKSESSLDYIAKAEEHAHIAPRWSIPTLLTKGEILMSNVVNMEILSSKSILSEPDYLAGVALVEEGYSLAKKLGHQRQARHALKLVNKFGQRKKRNDEVSDDLAERLSQLGKN